MPTAKVMGPVHVISCLDLSSGRSNLGAVTRSGRSAVIQCQPSPRLSPRPGQADGEGRGPFPVDTARPICQARGPIYGTVRVVPSPVPTMENVPTVVDVYVYAPQAGVPPGGGAGTLAMKGPAT